MPSLIARVPLIMVFVFQIDFHRFGIGTSEILFRMFQWDHPYASVYKIITPEISWLQGAFSPWNVLQQILAGVRERE